MFCIRFFSLLVALGAFSALLWAEADHLSEREAAQRAEVEALERRLALLEEQLDEFARRLSPAEEGLSINAYGVLSYQRQEARSSAYDQTIGDSSVFAIGLEQLLWQTDGDSAQLFAELRLEPDARQSHKARLGRMGLDWRRGAHRVQLGVLALPIGELSESPSPRRHMGVGPNVVEEVLLGAPWRAAAVLYRLEKDGAWGFDAALHEGLLVEPVSAGAQVRMVDAQQNLARFQAESLGMTLRFRGQGHGLDWAFSAQYQGDASQQEDAIGNSRLFSAQLAYSGIADNLELRWGVRGIAARWEIEERRVTSVRIAMLADQGHDKQFAWSVEPWLRWKKHWGVLLRREAVQGGHPLDHFAQTTLGLEWRHERYFAFKLDTIFREHRGSVPELLARDYRELKAGFSWEF